MYARLVLAVLVSICTLAIAQDTDKPASRGSLSGAIAQRASNAPLSTAMLFLQRERSNELLTVRVGNAGQFLITLDSGDYNIMVVADGFAPFCKKIRIEKNQTEHFVARLNTDAEAASMETVDPDSLKF